MTSTSYKAIKDVRLVVLAGVSEAHVDGQKIVGTWNELRRFSVPSKTVAERFVICPYKVQNILRFTGTYGFLDRPQGGKLERGTKFEQPLQEWLQEWREFQAFIRRHWQGPSLAKYFGMKDGEMLRRQGDQLWIEAESLRRLIELELFLTPNVYRRICAYPDCKQHRYFVAVNTRQQFCSRECTMWSLRRHKQEWWEQHGQQWREKRGGSRG